MSTTDDIGEGPMPRDDLGRSAEEKTDVGVLIVDDQPFFRSAAREVVGALPGFRALAEASSGPEAVAAVGDLHPQLVLLDVRMPGMDGIETARRITAGHPETVVVLISIEDITGVPSNAATCGAAAVIRKQDFRPSVLRELWAVHGPQHA